LKPAELWQWSHRINLDGHTARVLIFSSGDKPEGILYQVPYLIKRITGRIYAVFRLEKFFHWSVYDNLTQSFVWLLDPSQWAGFLREQRNPDPSGAVVVLSGDNREIVLSVLEKMKGEVPWLEWEKVKAAKEKGVLGSLSWGA
jgi:hypothetical protein